MTTMTAPAMHHAEVKALRLSLGLTQAQLAPKLLVSLRQYKRYEQEGIPSRCALAADHLRQLAAAKAKRRG